MPALLVLGVASCRSARDEALPGTLPPIGGVSTTDPSGSDSTAATTTVTTEAPTTTTTLPAPPAAVVTLTKVNDAKVGFPYSTNVAAVTSIGGTCSSEPGGVLMVDVTVTGATNRTASTPCTDGVWTLALNPGLDVQGIYTMLAAQTNSVGVLATSGTKMLTIDTTAPKVSSADPSAKR